MPVYEDQGPAPRYSKTTTVTSKTSTGGSPVGGSGSDRYGTVKGSYAPGAGGIAISSGGGAGVGALEAQTLSLETYPNEMGVLWRANALSIDNNSETVVVFDTTLDRHSFESGLSRDVLNLNAISILGTPLGMVYEVSGFVTWAADADGYRQVAIDSADGLAYQVVASQMAITTASIPTTQPFQIFLVRQSTDTTLQLKVKHTAGAALNITAAQFAIMRVK